MSNPFENLSNAANEGNPFASFLMERLAQFQFEMKCEATKERQRKELKKHPLKPKKTPNRFVKVYRVCARDGEGLYQSELFYHAVRDKNGDLPQKAIDTERHPNAWNDKKLSPQWCSIDDTSPYFFAFTGRTQLNNWICRNKWRQKMHELGGKVEVYKVRESAIMRGSCQVVFDMSKAEKISELRIDTFEPIA